ncbi:hypothetical protein G6N82_10320 [Altererythrobacter sp. BO-6]|uniref:hypothetical protein n=1 Tax=Altererythrobacter sp. BO-6 TaxID=2604537 RepID=UPI0013E1A70D|nr:hypothetical protein [Altererythrobacter sp. BO-6]QIG54492.1 hypothetical protein G6N82_10320 [Altererythrobacter sp. BO-6]
MTLTYHRSAIRDAICDWMNQSRYNHAVTLNTNRELTLPKLSRMFSSFCLLFDRALLGRSATQKLRANGRLLAIGFPENLSSNAHLHCHMDLAAAISRLGTVKAVEGLIDGLWNKFTDTAGSSHIEPLTSAGWGAYSTKRFNGDYLLSADFWPD